MEFTLEELKARYAQLKKKLLDLNKTIHGEEAVEPEDHMELYQKEIEEIEKLHPDLKFGDDL